LYRGLGPSLVLVSNGALQFMAYEELKKWTVRHFVPSKSEKDLDSIQYFLMGGAAKVFSATTTYPFALTRSRLYARSKPKKIKLPDAQSSSNATTTSPRLTDPKYTGMFDVFRKTYKQEGWRGFYRGLTVQLIKTAPSSAITFLIYETVIKAIDAANFQKQQQAAAQSERNVM